MHSPRCRFNFIMLQPRPLKAILLNPWVPASPLQTMTSQMATNTAAELQYNGWDACLVPPSVWYAPLISTCPQSQIKKIPYVTSQSQGDASPVDQTESDPPLNSTEHLRVSQMDSTDSLVSNFPWRVKGDFEMMSYECLQSSTPSEDPGIQILGQCHIWVLPQMSVTEQHQKIHPKAWWRWQHELSLACLVCFNVLMANTRNRDNVSEESAL